MAKLPMPPDLVIPVVQLGTRETVFRMWATDSNGVASLDRCRVPEAGDCAKVDASERPIAPATMD